MNKTGNKSDGILVRLSFMKKKRLLSPLTVSPSNGIHFALFHIGATCANTSMQLAPIPYGTLFFPATLFH
jgi:hypothetical protein